MSATLPAEILDTSQTVTDKDKPRDDVVRDKIDRQRRYPPLLKYFSQTLDTIIGLDKTDRERATNQMAKCVAYFDGRQDGQVVGGEWRDNELMPGELIAKDNQYFIQLNKLHMEMCRSNIELEVDPVDEASSEMKEASKFLQWRLNVNRERCLDEDFIQAENYSLLLKTVAYRVVSFDPKGTSEGKISKPKIKELPGQEKRIMVCRTCGRPQASQSPRPAIAERTGQAEAQQAQDVANDEIGMMSAEAAKCDYCGDTESRELVQKGSGGINLEYEEEAAGHVVTRRPDSSMVQLSMSARDIPSSLFVRWHLVLMRCQWEAMFPDKKIPSSGEDSKEASYAQAAQGRPSNQTWSDWESTSAETNGGSQFEKIGGDIVWLDPAIYADYKNKEDERLPDGQTLPKGVPLGQMYQHGCCVVRIGKTIMSYVGACKDKQWSMTVYGKREHALYGSGTNSLIPVQDNINDELSFIKANNLYNAAGREFIREGVLENDQLPALQKVGIVSSEFQGEKIVGGAYDRSAPGGLDQSVYGFLEAQRGSLQEHAGTSSLSAIGAADLKALGTATGVEASRDQAVARMVPNLKLKAGVLEREWGYQVAELEHDNYPPELFLKRAGKGNEKGEVRFTEQGVKAFFQCQDVRASFRIKPVEGSWMPNTPQQQRANATGFAEVASKIANPEIVSDLAEKFGMSMDLDEFGAARKVASLRVREYARVAGIIESQMPASPELALVVLQQVPLWAQINPEMDNHPGFMDAYEDWFMSDEGLNAGDLLRMSIEKAHEIHRNKGLVYQGQQQNAAQIAMQAPQQAIQEQLANQQKEQQGAEMAQAEQQGKQDMVQQALGQQMIKESDREHASQVKMNEAEHKAALDAAGREHQAALKPMPQTAQ